MAILKGFPPSNTIGGIRIHETVESQVKINILGVEERFRRNGCEFMMLPLKNKWGTPASELYVILEIRIILLGMYIVLAMMLK